MRERLRALSLPLRMVTTAAAVLSVGASFATEGKNLAYETPALTIPAALLEHSKKMEQRVYQVAANVYSAVGWALGNSIMVVGRDGLIIVDTTESVEAAKEILAEFRKITNKPIRAVIYTHNHLDHVGGVKGFVGEDDVKAGRVDIYAHERLVQEVAATYSLVAPILVLRSIYTFGVALERGPQGGVNEGIGPLLRRPPRSFIPPTKTFRDRLDIEVAGVKMHLRHAPSESEDEIVIWLPEEKVLLTAEVIQGESFPNLHTLRGAKYRDPVTWARSLDMMRGFGAAHVVPSHGRPVSGKQEVEVLLTAYGDAIRYVHDQTVRHMNKGLTPDELVEAVKLPAQLVGHPWLGEFYGTVKHSVRQIYFGYLGWFEGDPTFLDPLPRTERAARYVALMGGRDTVLKAAQDALGRGDYQWAAELVTYLIRIQNDDLDARRLKAQALRELGYRTANTNWRDWYVTAARELDRTLDVRVPRAGFRAPVPPDVARALSADILLSIMPVRLDPTKCGDVHYAVAFRFTDTGQTYGLEIRRGVAQLHDSLPQRANARLNLTATSAHRILGGQTTFLAALKAGEIKSEGDLTALEKFFGCFEDLPVEPPEIAAR